MLLNKMQAWWILAQISFIILTYLKSSFAGVCRPVPCSREPKILRFRYHEMEIDASSIDVHEGDDVSIICDASCVEHNYNPYLRWYGPDRHWISSEKQDDSIFVEPALSPMYQKLHIKSMKQADQGPYYCRGKLGDKVGWRLKSIILYVVPRPHHAQNLLNGRVEAVPRTESTTTTDVTEILMTSRLTSQTTTTLPSTVPPTTDQVSTTYSTSIPPTEDSSTTASTREFTSSQTHLNITDELSIDAETISPERLTYTNERPTSTDIVESRPLDGIGLDSVVSSCMWPTEFQCQNGHCISRQQLCDSLPDCSYGEDELDCDTISCPETHIACSDNSGCVSRQNLCNGVYDCKDRSDETFC